jgi:hypothetical protein
MSGLKPLTYILPTQYCHNFNLNTIEAIVNTVGTISTTPVSLSNMLN